jgi:hypothetical protein
MAQSRLESALLELLKRFMLLVIGSSLLSNALYIYGLSYYEGFYPVSTDGFKTADSF